MLPKICLNGGINNDNNFKAASCQDILKNIAEMLEQLPSFYSNYYVFSDFYICKLRFFIIIEPGK